MFLGALPIWDMYSTGVGNGLFFLICAFLHLTNASWAPQCTDVLLGPGDSDRSLAVCPHGAKSSKWSKICQPPRVGMGFPGDSAVRNAPVMQETQEMWV